jgi:hypothetical protein
VVREPLVTPRQAETAQQVVALMVLAAFAWWLTR